VLEKAPENKDKEGLLQYIRDSIIGKDEVIDTPFGPRRVTYADYTASGKSLSFIEDYLRSEVQFLILRTLLTLLTL
jgi:hypothetical protein